MRDFLKEFQSAKLRATAIEKGTCHTEKKISLDKPQLILYNVYKVEGMARKGIAFRVTMDEANFIASSVERKLKRLKSPADTGEDIFELTTIEIDRIQPVE